jgi:hypothetical protein
MSTRPQLSNFSSITNAPMAAAITGTPTIIDKLSMMSYSFSWSGASPVGTISIQVSNDYALSAVGQVSNPGTWSTLTLQYAGAATTTIAISGNTGNGLVDIFQTGAYAIRPIYTATSGNGSLSAIFNAKVA